MNHTHKYIKRKIGSKGYKIYACGFPGCTHTIPYQDKVYGGLSNIVGRRSICWRCGIEFIITNPRLTKQHCVNCTKGRNKNIDVSILKGLESLINKKIT